MKTFKTSKNVFRLKYVTISELERRFVIMISAKKWIVWNRTQNKLFNVLRYNPSSIITFLIFNILTKKICYWIDQNSSRYLNNDIAAFTPSDKIWKHEHTTSYLFCRACRFQKGYRILLKISIRCSAMNLYWLFSDMCLYQRFLVD